jgi:NAD+ synthase (glutamine-hydrolysing)
VRLIKLGACALNQTPLDWDGNAARIRAALADARAAGVSILCLPELCISGYGCEDAFLSPAVLQTAQQVLLELLPETAGMIVAVGLPLAVKKAVYNAAALLVDRQVAGVVCKRFLAGDGLHYEPRWFRPWPAGQQTTVWIGDREVPVGDLCFEVGGVTIGFEICEDAWVANRPGHQLALRGVDLILNPSASHFAFAKQAVRERYVLDGSRAFGVAYVYSNLLGNEAGRAIYDGGNLIASTGAMLARGRRFSFRDLELTTAVVDVDQCRIARARMVGAAPDQTVDPGRLCRSFSYPELVPEPAGPTPAGAAVGWEAGPHLAEEEFTRAVALGLLDYLRKSRSRGFVVSLSGGADSAAVACLVAQMVALGRADLGTAGFADRLAHIAHPALRGPAEEVVHQLLTCVYQSTRNSSQTTREAARAVAAAISAEFLELDVDPLVLQYVAMISGAVGRELTWQQDDVALQNIQARVRAPGVWLLANLKGALLLATSNRSEAAVGYATMDGDTCGSLSPIAGIDKAFLRRWLSWLQHTGPEGGVAIPALDAVTVQEPTAELRPPAAGQTDERDLMPYPVLDAVEEAAIRDRQAPLEVLATLRARFPEHDEALLGQWIERFFLLWCRNQWKRERYAPAFHVDDRNLDPRSWCRFPILSGGFARELELLRRHLATSATPLHATVPGQRS